METLVEFITNSLLNIISKEAIVFIISLMPILELRGGLIAASLLKIPYIKASIIVILGNILPIPFVLFLIERILNIMEKWKLTKNLSLRSKPKKCWLFLRGARFHSLPNLPITTCRKLIREH